MADTNIAAGVLTPQNALTKNTATLTILNGETDSNAIDLNGNTATHLITPAALTNSSIRFKASMDGVTFYPVYKNDGTNTLYSITVATSEARWYPLDLATFKGARWIELNVASAETPGVGLKRSFQLGYTGV